MAAMIAAILALLTAGMLVWFALHDVLYASGTAGDWSSVVLVNVFGGVVGAGVVLVPAGFTLARRIAGAWTLCALCTLHVVATIFLAPLLWGTAISDQLEFVFGFNKVNGVAAGLALIFSALTAIMAAIAGSVKSHEPPAATPPHP